MDNQQVFHLFPRLPAELRHEIWRAALSSYSLTKVLFIDGAIRLSPLVWNPSTVGQVCHEARELMTTTLHRVSRPLIQDGCLYVNFGTNILHFGLASVAPIFIASLGEPAFSSLACAALIWTTWDDIAKCFISFADKYRCLSTVFIFTAGEPANVQAVHPADVHMASIAAAFKRDPDYFGTSTLLDPAWISFQLRAWFHAPLKPPRVVLLPL
ncbi:hypothetical protein HD806DRAFT_80612 [Xylariaceae sp. AK1471]|nr:hypothetical protein HD806DRAFT_80612 [Xylariaceae sp. AK1471]